MKEEKEKEKEKENGKKINKNNLKILFLVLFSERDLNIKRSQERRDTGEN